MYFDIQLLVWLTRCNFRVVSGYRSSLKSRGATTDAGLRVLSENCVNLSSRNGRSDVPPAPGGAFIRSARRGISGGWRVVGALLFGAMIWGTPIIAAQESIGKAEAVKGAVHVDRDGKREAAKEGDPVFLHDKWQTGAESSVEIVFLDDSRVKMSANVALEITEYLYTPSEKKRGGLISLMSGKARFLVADLQDYKQKRFRVQTQTSVVGTRDTDFTVWVVSDELTKVFCGQNVVQLFNRTNPDKIVLLTANMVSEVYGHNLPASPRFATPAERSQFLKGVETIGSSDKGAGGKRVSSEEKGPAEEPEGREKPSTPEKTPKSESPPGQEPSEPKEPPPPQEPPAPQSPPTTMLPPPETLPTTIPTPRVTIPPLPTSTRPTVPTTTTIAPPPTLPPPPPPPPPGAPEFGG